MTMQYSTTLRNNQLDQVEVTLGASPYLQIFSGAAPANAAAADTGTLLCEIALPADWMNAAAAGSKSKAGTWLGTGHANAGTGTNAGHFRIKDTTKTTCHIQGTVTANLGGGDMTIDNISIAEDQAVSVNGFAIAAGNA
jgi:hypothetical protein